MRRGLRFNGFAIALLAALAALGLGATTSAAQWTEVMLWTFCSNNDCSDGLKPQGGVIVDPDGDLWGTTLEGGSKNAGVLFDVVLPGLASKTTAKDTEIIFYNFCQIPSKQLDCSDGAWPTAGLAAGQFGNFFGTTYTGGSGGPRGASGGGTVFALLPGGQFKTLYEFCRKGHPCLRGAFPAYGLLANQAGTVFYGTNVTGGSHGGGTVFRVTASGHVASLYAFCALANCKDGKTPSGGLVSDPSGNLYGTTSEGGSNGEGAVFKLDPSTGAFRVLYSFCPNKPCTDGQQPKGKLAIDASGNLYGTASAGGTHGEGAVFKIVPGVGGPSAETVLYDFCPGGTPCIDGSSPAAGVAISLSGTDLYGTTAAGGTTDQGTVFDVPIGGGSESLLHTFCVSNEPVCTDSDGNPDGSTPSGPLTLDGEGNIFGTTDTGGGNLTGVNAGGGTVYELINPSPGT